MFPLIGMAATAGAGMLLDDDDEAAPPPPPPPPAVRDGSHGFGYSDLREDPNWGGDPGVAAIYANKGLGGMDMYNKAAGRSGNRANWWQDQAGANRGPQSIEDMQLSGNEAHTRGFDQAGAMSLARDAAMGNAPSAAEIGMQGGLDQAIAAQQSMMGGARGNAGIALASGNAAGNAANLQSQAIGQMGMARANEMAQARGLYGGLAGQMRDQDLARLGQSTQNRQFNAGLNDAYSMGAGGLANQAGNTMAGLGNTASGFYTGSQNPYTQQANVQAGNQTRMASSQDAANSGWNTRSKNETDAENADDNQTISAVGTGLTGAASIIGAFGGKK